MPIDVTFTVKASVANGRRLMRHEDGSTYWEPAQPPAGDTPLVAPVIPKRKRRKSEEGDK